MTVPTTTARRVVEGNGTGTTFATDFVFLDEDSLVVTIVESDGDEILQVLNTDYTVTGGDGTTGSVVMTTAPASGETLVIEREEEYLQQTDLLGGDPFNANTIETQFDKVVMMIQQLLDVLNRAILAPITRDPDADPLTLPEPVSGEFLRGKSDETGWENVAADDAFGSIDPDVIGLPITIANGGTGQQLAASMQKGNYLATTGSGGAYAATSVPAATSLVDGMLVRIEANHTATSSMTFDLDGQGAKSILDAHGVSLPNGGLQSGGIYTLSYDAGTDAWFTVGHTRPYVSKLSAVRVYTSNTSWSKPDDLDYIEVEVEGGGGGGGGVVAGDTAGGGGGGGEYGYARVAAASLSSSETVTIGAAGTAGSSSGGNGGDGGTTSFGSHVTAAGGKGGNGDATSNAPDSKTGGAGGSGGTGGDFHITGGNGKTGAVLSGAGDAEVGALGNGGDGGGPLGGGGGAGGYDTAGSAGGNYGGGGGGASDNDGSDAGAGGAGAKGVCIVKEYTFEFV